MSATAKTGKKSKKTRFFTKTTNEKEEIFKKRKAPSTNEATKVWMKCFNDYLKEKNLPDADLLTLEDNQLPNVLSDFYTEVRKSDAEGEYKTSTLKCIRAAINRHYKATRSLDILSDPRFIKSNEMFTGVAKKAKQEGRGEVESRPPIEEEDMKKNLSLLCKKFEWPS